MSTEESLVTSVEDKEAAHHVLITNDGSQAFSLGPKAPRAKTHPNTKGEQMVLKIRRTKA